LENLQDYASGQLAFCNAAFSVLIPFAFALFPSQALPAPLNGERDCGRGVGVADIGKISNQIRYKLRKLGRCAAL
jgi:hypothetical protein